MKKSATYKIGEYIEVRDFPYKNNITDCIITGIPSITTYEVYHEASNNKGKIKENQIICYLKGPTGSDPYERYFGVSSIIGVGDGNKTEIAIKKDEEKPRLDLLDSSWLIGVGRVLTLGCIKYSPNNWRKGFSYSRLIAAAQRHLLAFNNGEDNDPETEESHLLHLSCCVMFLYWHTLFKPELDDRYTSKEIKVKNNV